MNLEKKINQYKKIDSEPLKYFKMDMVNNNIGSYLFHTN